MSRLHSTPHGRNSWPLAHSRVWPPVATTRYCWLAPTSDSSASLFLSSSGSELTNWRVPADLSRSESALLYAWRLTANQFVLAPNPLWYQWKRSIEISNGKTHVNFNSTFISPAILSPLSFIPYMIDRTCRLRRWGVWPAWNLGHGANYLDGGFS
jgi:hypothetical protein